MCLEQLRRKAGDPSKNFYWCSTNKFEGKSTLTGPCTAGFEPLASMPEAKPTVTARFLSVDEWEVTVKNSGRRIAFFCQLLLTDKALKPVHGTYYSDNFFSLLPGEKKVIIIRTSRRGFEYRLRFCENMGTMQNIAVK